MAVRNRAKEPSVINDSAPATKVVKQKPPTSPVKTELLRKQLELVKNQHVRAVPGGYYTGLINDMHKDQWHFKEKSTFLQMEYLTPLLQQTKQTAQSIDRFNEETRLEERKLEKSKAPITFSASSIRCTLPVDYHQLENLSPVAFLARYAKPLLHREQTVLKLIRKSQRDPTIDIEDAKDIICEYFHPYKSHEDIDRLFDSLQINSMSTLQSKELVIICCYAERYFLHQLARKDTIVFQRPLQEVIDFEFLRRKLDGLKLTNGLQRLLTTLAAPEMTSA